MSGEVPIWLWGLYINSPQKEEQPVIPLLPTEEIILIVSEPTHRNIKSDTKLFQNKDTFEVRTVEGFDLLCAMLAQDMGATCLPPKKLSSRPIFAL